MHGRATLERGTRVLIARRRRGWLNAVAFLASLAFSAGIFLTLDWLYSAMLQARMPEHSQRSCTVHDPVRHHALKPNCGNLAHWGSDTFEVRTNSLGLRDSRIRDVPLVNEKPRILMLGDSFTLGMVAWSDSYVGKIAARLPQYDILNGGVASYSPSNYLNTTRILLAKGVSIDEVIVFMDLSDVADEAHIYQDADAKGTVRVLEENQFGDRHRRRLKQRFLLTNTIVKFFRKFFVGLGFYRFAAKEGDDPFKAGRGAWTYQSESEIERSTPTRYSPLGVEGGIAKEKNKMTQLWEELKKRDIPITIVVYPWPAQLIHDNVESKQVRIWREWCENKCKRFTSLFPDFFAHKDQCSGIWPGCWYLRYFIFGDIHYNANGNALVADSVIHSLENTPVGKRFSRPPTVASRIGTSAPVSK
jgi:hypothetical protein